MRAKRIITDLLVFAVLTTIVFFAGVKYEGARAVVPVQAAPIIKEDPAVKQAFFDAAKTYGRAGCGDIHLAELTARYSVSSGLPAPVVAALVAKESSCNSLAVAHDGGVGLFQIMPAIWNKEYNFADVNLFNSDQSLKVGTQILAKLVKQYGLRDGLRHYNGAGKEADAYAERVMALAGGK